MAAISTAEDIAFGCAFSGVATMDSTVYNSNLRHAGLASLGRFVQTIREMHQDRISSWRRKEFCLGWAKRRIPIGMVVSGPRAMRMEGRLADQLK